MICNTLNISPSPLKLSEDPTSKQPLVKKKKYRKWAKS